jgi:hypothetical protein
LDGVVVQVGVDEHLRVSVMVEPLLGDGQLALVQVLGGVVVEGVLLVMMVVAVMGVSQSRRRRGCTIITTLAAAPVAVHARVFERSGATIAVAYG